MKRYNVYFVRDAEQDLLEIYQYIKETGYPLTATKLVSELTAICSSLSNNPSRGHIPHELEEIGVFEYREIFLQFYRIIYEVTKKDVFIHSILDGRRDIQSILHQRILR